LAGKNEVAVEFALPTDEKTNGHIEGSTKNRGRKAAAGTDELVEMRFYIPGTILKKEKTEGDDVKKEGSGGEEEPEQEEEEPKNRMLRTSFTKL
jgi:structure-specific recognition protein 1